MTDQIALDETFDMPEFTDPPAAPSTVAERWLASATDADVREPRAMTLATADADGGVHARTVDVRTVDQDGLVFGTAADSPTGTQLEANPRAALQVYWPETGQQLRFEGAVRDLGDDASDELFAARSPKSRAATAAATQSAPFPTQDADQAIDGLIADANALLADGRDVPRPPTWRAWRLEPTTVEFWHGSRDRIHRRLRYTAGDGGSWSVERVQP